MNDKVTAQLRKILALADPSRGATPAEVEAIKVGQDSVGVSTKYEAQYHQPILRALQESLGVNWVMYSHWTPNCMRVITKIIFIGERTDVLIATTCWSWLEKQFPASWKQFRLENPGTPSSWVPTRSFYAGMAQGIIDTNKAQRAALSAPLQDRFALVLVSKEEAIKAEMAVAFPKLKTLKSNQRSDTAFDAYYGGKKKGQAIKLKNQLGGDLL